MHTDQEPKGQTVLIQQDSDIQDQGEVQGEPEQFPHPHLLTRLLIQEAPEGQAVVAQTPFRARQAIVAHIPPLKVLREATVLSLVITPEAAVGVVPVQQVRLETVI
ncbi:MAG: hypothetical protein EB119_10815 [Synechococcaceae bacterium WBB_34_004]|nr:hypothetical protein [Synechococcaceae bacterium WBB_34_004]